MKIWVDDIRTPPDKTWTWVKSSRETIRYMTNWKIAQARGWVDGPIDVMSLDHDLGGEDTTRYIVLWCCNHDWWPVEVIVHSANPVGVEWLEGMIERYKS
jgi:hypothetical protein